MAEETKKTYDKAVAEFIKENKPKGQVVYDENNQSFSDPLFFRSDAMDKLIQKLEDSGISVVDENGEPSVHSLKSNEKQQATQPQEDLSAPTGVKIMIRYGCI